jgi:hypothetical protein
MVPLAAKDLEISCRSSLNCPVKLLAPGRWGTASRCVSVPLQYPQELRQMVRCSANGVRLVIPAGGLELGNYMLVAGAGFCEGVGQATLDDFTRPRTRKASVTGAEIVFGPFAVLLELLFAP